MLCSNGCMLWTCHQYIFNRKLCAGRKKPHYRPTRELCCWRQVHNKFVWWNVVLNGQVKRNNWLIYEFQEYRNSVWNFCFVCSISWCICCVICGASYVSTSVSHSDDLPCCGTFLLHQGIQRRIALTIVQDGRTDLHWTDIHALTIGCVRSTKEWKQTEGDAGILTLNAAVVSCARRSDDTRYLWLSDTAWWNPHFVYENTYHHLMVVTSFDDML